MPDFLEKKLEEGAAKHGFSGRRAARYIYGAMNRMGAMIGNRISAKGRRMEAKHTADVRAGRAR